MTQVLLSQKGGCQMGQGRGACCHARFTFFGKLCWLRAQFHFLQRKLIAAYGLTFCAWPRTFSLFPNEAYCRSRFHLSQKGCQAVKWGNSLGGSWFGVEETSQFSFWSEQERLKGGWSFDAYLLEDSPLIRQIFCCTMGADRNVGNWRVLIYLAFAI